jgi:hypothetical protein
MEPDPTPAEILALPLDENDSGKGTVRGYLVALIEAMWSDDISGKDPFGNSGWRGDFGRAFFEVGWVQGTVEANGYVSSVDEEAIDRLVRSAIQGLADGA